VEEKKKPQRVEKAGQLIRRRQIKPEGALVIEAGAIHTAERSFLNLQEQQKSPHSDIALHTLTCLPLLQPP
jgi:hypothetical protein